MIFVSDKADKKAEKIATHRVDRKEKNWFAAQFETGVLSDFYCPGPLQMVLGECFKDELPDLKDNAYYRVVQHFHGTPVFEKGKLNGFRMSTYYYLPDENVQTKMEPMSDEGGRFLCLTVDQTMSFFEKQRYEHAKSAGLLGLYELGKTRMEEDYFLRKYQEKMRCFRLARRLRKTTITERKMRQQNQRS